MCLVFVITYVMHYNYTFSPLQELLIKGVRKHLRGKESRLLLQKKCDAGPHGTRLRKIIANSLPFKGRVGVGMG